MTLAQLVKIIEEIAAAQPAVATIVPNDVFALNSYAETKYGVFAWTQGEHSGGLERYANGFRFTFFYVDRLTDDASNRLEVQSVGIETLGNVLRALGREFEMSEWTYVTFNQRFADSCAGVYAQVTIYAPVTTSCVDLTGGPDEPGDFSPDFSRDFD